MKRSPALRTLSSEHHTALVLARRAALGAAGASGCEVAKVWSEIVHRFEAELEPHFHREETLLLPALMRIGEKEVVERTLAEHAQLRSLVHDRVRDAESLQLIADLLKAHIRFEERELFEIAQLRLPEFDLTMRS